MTIGPDRGGIRMAFQGLLETNVRLTLLDGGSYTLVGTVGFLILTPVLRFEERLQNEQLQARGMIVEVAGVKQFAPPYQISELHFEARLPPPAAGEHSEEILRESGFSADEIAGLRAQKVITITR